MKIPPAKRVEIFTNLADIPGPHQGHTISYNMVGTNVQVVKSMSQNGDVRLDPNQEFWVDDVNDTYLYCETCRENVGPGNLPGLSEEWDVV